MIINEVEYEVRTFEGELNPANDGLTTCRRPDETGDGIVGNASGGSRAALIAPGTAAGGDSIHTGSAPNAAGEYNYTVGPNCLRIEAEQLSSFDRILWAAHSTDATFR